MMNASLTVEPPKNFVHAYPVEWFAEVGYQSLLTEIGESLPDYDWSEELDSVARCEEARREYLAARQKDASKVMQWLKSAKVTALSPLSHGVDFGGRAIHVFGRVPALKTWAGNQNLRDIIRRRQRLLPAEGDPRTYECPMTDAKGKAIGGSGFDPSVCPDALDLGFSPDGQVFVGRPGRELLAIIGIETLPLTVHPDQAIEYLVGQERWKFRVGSRGKYYGRWERAERIY